MNTVENIIIRIFFSIMFFKIVLVFKIYGVNNLPLWHNKIPNYVTFDQSNFMLRLRSSRAISLFLYVLTNYCSEIPIAFGFFFRKKNKLFRRRVATHFEKSRTLIFFSYSVKYGTQSTYFEIFPIYNIGHIKALWQKNRKSNFAWLA